MSNLIVTILSIALAAIVVLSGVSYLADLFAKNTHQVRANSLIEQSRHLSAAQTQYMVDNGFSSFNDFQTKTLVTNKVLPGPIPILNLPTFAHGINNYYHTCNGSTGTLLDGYYVNILRSSCSMNGRNVLHYSMQDSATC